MAAATKPSPLQKSGTLARIPELDGLRGIAILSVVVFHYISTQLEQNTHPIANVLRFATSFGWMGVDLFFVLSGFLIGSILIAQKGSPRYFRTFYRRRLVRIVPNYFLLLVIFFIIWNLPYFSNNHFLTGHNIIPFWSYFAMLHNIYMAVYESLGNDALSVTWSIGIEEQFYLVFPFLVYFLNIRWLPLVLIILIIGAVIVRGQFEHWIPKYVLLPARMDGLSMGFLVAYFDYKGIIAKHAATLNRWLLWLLPVVLAICIFFYWKYNDLGIAKHTLFYILFSIMLIFALTWSKSWYGSFLRNRVLMWIGTISYSLYLFHYMMLGLAHYFTGQDDIGIYDTADIFISVAAFAAALLFSWVVYQRLEKPMVTFGKRFKY